jgi:hypothetical protein
MELAMKMEELNLEPRELTINELDEASGGFAFALGIVVGALVCGGAYLLTEYIKTRLR